MEDREINKECKREREREKARERDKNNTTKNYVVRKAKTVKKGERTHAAKDLLFSINILFYLMYPYNR